jgi:hypothetical protein
MAINVCATRILIRYACGDLFAGHGIWLMLDADRSSIGKAGLVG